MDKSCNFYNIPVPGNVKCGCTECFDKCRVQKGGIFPDCPLNPVDDSKPMRTCEYCLASMSSKQM